MPNPIMSQINGQKLKSNNIFNIVSQAKSLMNGNNPMMNTVMSMVQGKDPKQVFYSECAKRNINPDDILGMINSR